MLTSTVSNEHLQEIMRYDRILLPAAISTGYLPEDMHNILHNFLETNRVVQLNKLDKKINMSWYHWIRQASFPIKHTQ